ncbi:MAG: DUF5050 domain-containing protein [bacterium]|nr:DUF5050 domain-containing protein [bacterium]
MAGIVACFMLAPAIAEAATTDIYWAGTVAYGPSDDFVSVAHLDSSPGEDLITGQLSGIRDLELDATGGYMYWAHGSTGTVKRANLDGSGVTDLVTGLSFASGIALDVSGSYIYITDAWAGSVLRANLDGSGVTALVTGLSSPADIALDLVNGHMYLATGTNPGKIQRAGLDGSSVTDIVTGPAYPSEVALDVSGGHIYYQHDFGDITRANLDGSGVTALASSFGGGLSLDLGDGHMYWYSFGSVYRANLDGSGATAVITGLTNAFDIALYDSASAPAVPIAWWPVAMVLLFVAVRALRRRTA